jgi:hypothetical protein
MVRGKESQRETLNDTISDKFIAKLGIVGRYEQLPHQAVSKLAA